MANDSLFGVHAAALEVRSQRMGLLASNIANASTPGYKAKDIDFQEALGAAENAGGFDAQAARDLLDGQGVPRLGRRRAVVGEDVGRIGDGGHRHSGRS